jgi:hypothetical protein
MGKNLQRVTYSRQSFRRFFLETGLLLCCLAFALLFFYKVTYTREATFLAYPDNSVQSYAWLTKAGAAWRNFELPLWDFTINSGTSFVGELQTAPFYPPTIIFSWLTRANDQYAIDMYIVLHYGLATWLMLLFLRMNKLSLQASIAGAIIYAFVGTIAQKAIGQANIFMGMVYLPIILGCFQKGLNSEESILANRWLYLSGIALGFSLLAGHLQPCVHSVVALSFLMIFMCYRTPGRSWRSACKKLAFVGVVSVLFTTIQLIPTVEYLAHSYRWVGTADPIAGLAKPPYVAYATFQDLGAHQLLSVFKPMYDIPDGATLFITLTGLVLACVGCFHNSRLSWFAFCLVLFSVLFARGGHTIVGQISWYIPVLNLVREPIRMLFLYQFGMSVLAAMGAQRLSELVTKNRRGQALCGTIFIALILFEAFKLQDRLFQPNGSGLTPRQSYARNKIIDFLERQSTIDGEVYRIINYKDILPANIGNVFPHIHSTSGHRATMYAPYLLYLSRDWALGSATFDKLGAKYIVSAEPLDNFQEVMYADGLHLYQRDRPLPVFQLLTDRQELKPAQVSAVKWSENAVECTLQNSEAGQLVMAQPYYPGWQAYVDDKRRELRKTDIFMSVQLFGNERRVAWVYSPYYPWVGLVATILAISGFLTSLRVRHVDDRSR